jgi:hypothetical protein|tara:strand:- start:695 stop:1297 length:603 start_codon:yes stop_codon:yes gene_type:complete
MSGTFPNSPAPRSIDVESIEPTLISVSTNLRRQARSRGGQRWMFKCVFAPTTRADFDPIFAFSIAQRGQFETFNFVPKTIGTSRGISSENPVLNAGFASGLNAVTVDGLTQSTSNILRSGDFIKFSNHTKVYMATSDVSSNASGVATINFAPSLESAVVDNNTVTISSVPFQVAFTSDGVSYTTDASGYYSYQVDLVEVT